jgi:hypothetical protein
MSMNENGQTRLAVGGEIYVELRRSNGEILEIGLDE